jgi:hypothetical protein
MPEHYTKNTRACRVWCNRCCRITRHRVDGGRRGPCLEHVAQLYTQAQLARIEQEAKRKMQPSLFGDRS